MASGATSQVAKCIVPCFRCGLCCSAYQVELSQQEAWRIASALGLTLEHFIRDYTDPRWQAKSMLLRQVNGACIFLEHVNHITRCRIHAFKPAMCSGWAPSLLRKECRQGLARWGLTVNASGDVIGPAENLRLFRIFLISLRETDKYLAQSIHF